MNDTSATARPPLAERLAANADGILEQIAREYAVSTFEVVRNLPLQIGQLDGVVVDDRDPADAGRAEVQRHRRPEAAGADDQRMRRQQPALALDADLVEQDVPRITQQLVVVHVRSIAAPQ